MFIPFADMPLNDPGLHGYAVGWGTLTLINAGLAQGKGRSGLLWWVASLFLGPIATFLLVITEKRSDPPSTLA